MLSTKTVLAFAAITCCLLSQVVLCDLFLFQRPNDHESDGKSTEFTEQDNKCQDDKDEYFLSSIGLVHNYRSFVLEITSRINNLVNNLNVKSLF